MPYHINLGKKTLRWLKVPWSNNTGRLVAELIRIGILAQKRKAWPDGHKVRQFWVNFPFELAESSVQTDFDVALLAVLGSVEIRRRFGLYHATKIVDRARASVSSLNRGSNSVLVS